MLNGSSLTKGDRLHVIEGHHSGKVLTFEERYIRDTVYARAENGVTLILISLNQVEKLDR